MVVDPKRCHTRRAKSDSTHKQIAGVPLTGMDPGTLAGLVPLLAGLLDLVLEVRKLVEALKTKQPEKKTGSG